MLRALAVALALLLVSEAVLQARVPPADPTPLPWRNGHPHHWLVPAGDGKVRTWLGQVVDARPPAGRLRLAVFGSSAVAGEGTSLQDSFPLRLERRLRERGLDVEVVNLGLPGQDSGHHLSALRRALRELHPHVLLVYAGNNELHRVRAYRFLHPRWSGDLERIRLGLQRLALYRALRPAAEDPPPAPQAGLHEIEAPVGAAERALAAGYLRRNLEGMIEASRAAGVPLVLCTVAANDESPPDYGRRGSTPAHRHYAAGLRARRAGDTATARRELDLARELDPAPNRVLPSWNAVIRDLRPDHLYDLEEALRATSRGGLLAHDLFRDNCHFHVAGNERVATLLEAALDQAGLLRPPGR